MKPKVMADKTREYHATAQSKVCLKPVRPAPAPITTTIVRVPEPQLDLSINRPPRTLTFPMYIPQPPPRWTQPETRPVTHLVITHANARNNAPGHTSFPISVEEAFYSENGPNAKRQRLYTRVLSIRTKVSLPLDFSMNGQRFSGILGTGANVNMLPLAIADELKLLKFDDRAEATTNSS